MKMRMPFGGGDTLEGRAGAGACSCTSDSSDPFVTVRS
jgi:hypothetical protein